jgi:arylsulfatase A-like enzyme
MRNKDYFVIAVWAGTVFGLLEGIMFCISRAYPASLAPYKTSSHILWITPIIDISLFCMAAVLLLALMKVTHKWSDPFKVLAAYGFFIFLGFFTVISGPKIVHLLSAVLLSLGLTVALCRKLRGSEIMLTIYLRRRLLWLPIMIVTLGVAVHGYERAREIWMARQLPVAPSEAVNVLIIVMDTVRYDSFARSDDNSLTPNLDRITAEGFKFESAWATSSWSLPSQASIITGCYPHEHGADWPRLQLDDNCPTLAEYFAGLGYVTGAFSGNAAWATPEYLGRGFLRFDVYILEDFLRRTVHGRKIGRLLWEIGYHYAGRGKKAPKVNSQFLEFLNDFPDRPFFAYICYMDVNQTFHNRKLNHFFWEKEPTASEVYEAYEQGLRELDEHIGDLFNKLERRNLLENTLVVITSDHGQSFGADIDSDHEPWGHGTSLYSEQLKVPLFVNYSKEQSTGWTVPHPVSLRIIPAMISQFLGLPNSPFGEEVSNPSDKMNNFLRVGDIPLLATLNYDDKNFQSVIWNEWQYIKNLNGTQKGEELFNLALDPHEKQNLASVHPIVIQARKLLRGLLTTSSQTRPAGKAF